MSTIFNKLVNKLKINKYQLIFQVIVATCQIILDVVRHGFLKISNFNLMIFDECHHAQKEHPMLKLMEQFSGCPDIEQPRVIGLTGMLTSASIKPQNVLENLCRLESTYRATISTVKGLKAYADVLMHSTAPIEKIELCERSTPGTIARYLLKQVSEMLTCIDSWPVEQQTLRFDASDLKNDRQPKPKKKLEKICNTFSFHVDYLGGNYIFIIIIAEYN